ncbi:Astacin-like metalloendopeptidase [Strongyloides ratti]|uniref:Metalloendopeptidase n=1 Tax=Strongyloides ratti TaxID=34506 RepID=A0A090LJ83_STRRB|nr:Astacin-like metalloendopeptidase [Strongyloides ratti]CEF69892.1 Astacin-like metalloendopeptidase [Strongyloides ratti]
MKKLVDIIILLVIIFNIIENNVLSLKFNKNNLILSRKRRAALDHTIGRFDEIPIKYKVNKNVNESLIDKAVKSFQKESCLIFEKDNLLNGSGIEFVFSNDTYYADVVGKVSTVIPLQIGIPKKPTKVGCVIHKMLHALGLLHEQQRKDRDQYVTIFYNKINKERLHNFKMGNFIEQETYGIKYDYGSILHYSRFNGHISGKKNKFTMKAKNKHYTMSIGQNRYFSFLDTKLLNKRYCKDKCKNEEKITCYHGGYPNPNNCKICKCPTFYKPPFCKFVKKSPQKCGNKINLASKNYQTLKMKGIIDCYYILRAEENQKVEIIIKKAKSLLTQVCEPGSGLNIKFLKNKALSPACFCGRTTNYTIISEGREVVLRYAGKSNTDFFELQFKSVKN